MTQHITRSAPWLVLCLAFAVLVGWSVESLAIVRVLPDAAPMQPNTAIGLACVALALLSSRARILLALVLMLVALAVAEYVGASVVSGHLFFDPWYAKGTVSPGLMAPGTALGLVLCVVPIAWRNQSASSVCGGAALALGLVSVVGYVAGWGAPYSWGWWATDMAIHTGISLMLLGGAVLARGRPDWGASVALMAGLCGAGLSLAIGEQSVGALVFAALAAALVGRTSYATREARDLADRWAETAGLLVAMSASLSHDMRAPLLRTANWCAIVLDDHGDTLPADVTRILRKFVLSPVDQMIALTVAQSDLIKDITAERTVEIVDLTDAIRDTLELRAGEIADAHATIEVAPMPSMRCSPGGIRCVLGNLLGNALKYRDHGHGCEISIDYEATPTEHVISVSDNGIGFDPALAERVFGWRFRIHDDSNKLYAGNGWGLGTARMLVSRWNGRIWAESAGVGTGSRFCFTVPR